MAPTQCSYVDAPIASTEVPDKSVQGQNGELVSHQNPEGGIPSPVQVDGYVDPVYASSPPQPYFDYSQPLLINTANSCYQAVPSYPMGYYCTAPMYIPNNGSPMLVSGSPIMFSASPVAAPVVFQSSPSSTATASPAPAELSCSTPPHQSQFTPDQLQMQYQPQQPQPAGDYMMPQGPYHPQYVPMGSYPSPAGSQLPVQTGSSPTHESYVVAAASHLERLSISNAPMYKPTPSQNLSQPNMADIWHEQFEKCFTKFNQDSWSLEPKPDGVNSEEVHGIFEDTAKIRFVCKNCHHAWTSMQGKVKFWYIKKGEKGKVFFRLFGQMCRDCKQKRNCNDIQDALWYPDEIVKVVYNVHCKVGSVYYDMQQPQLMIQRRVGRPKGQHNSELCVACTQGICRRNVRC